MRSLDFEEFLWALSYKEEQIDDLFSYMKDLKTLPDIYLKVFSQLYRDYIFIGGMPEVVQTYVHEKTFTNVFLIQKRIYKDYEDDITNYVEGLDKAKVKNVYRHISSQLAKDNHKFQISKLGHGVRAREYKGIKEWLLDVGIINIAYNLESLELPLASYELKDKMSYVITWVFEAINDLKYSMLILKKSLKEQINAEKSYYVKNLLVTIFNQFAYNDFSDVVADRTAFFAYCAGKNTFRRLCRVADAGVVLAVRPEAICILVFCAALGDCRCGNCFRNECRDPLFPAERTCRKTDCSFHIPFDFHRCRCGDCGHGGGQRAAEALCKFCRFFRTVDTISMVLFIGGGAVVSRNYSDRPPAAFSISRLKKKNHNL